MTCAVDPKDLKPGDVICERACEWPVVKVTCHINETCVVCKNLYRGTNELFRFRAGWKTWLKSETPSANPVAGLAEAPKPAPAPKPAAPRVPKKRGRPRTGGTRVITK